MIGRSLSRPHTSKVSSDYACVYLVYMYVLSNMWPKALTCILHSFQSFEHGYSEHLSKGSQTIAGQIDKGTRMRERTDGVFIMRRTMHDKPSSVFRVNKSA